MNCTSLVGVAHTTGLTTGLHFDPAAPSSECWIVTIGEHARGKGNTPEGALDAALRMITAEDVGLTRTMSVVR